MVKYLIILSCCLFLSCSTSDGKNEEKQVPLNFILQFYQSVVGICNPTMSSYIDSSNGNLCYIATNCDSISIFCMKPNEIKSK